MRQILWSDHDGAPNCSGEGPEVLERRVLLQLQGDRLIDSLGHLMETCVSKLIVSGHKLYNIINLLKKITIGRVY